MYCFTDAPKFISNQTIYYSWEGNPINISCDVQSNPPASVHWRREKLVLPAKNTTNLKTYSTGRKIILEVSLHYISTNCIILAVIYYFRIYLSILIYKLSIILSYIIHIPCCVYFMFICLKRNFMHLGHCQLMVSVSLFTYMGLLI